MLQNVILFVWVIHIDVPHSVAAYDYAYDQADHEAEGEDYNVAMELAAREAAELAVKDFELKTIDDDLADKKGADDKGGGDEEAKKVVEEAAREAAKIAVKEFVRNPEGKAGVVGKTSDMYEVCRKPKLSGKCRADMPRWYFDMTCMACKVFTYGGCGGNDNNFNSGGECVKRCGGLSMELAGYGGIGGMGGKEGEEEEDARDF